jgi:hypothetical protein
MAVSTVDEYLDQLAPPLPDVGRTLRRVIDAGRPGAACAMWHGVPTWRIDGEPVAMIKGYSSFVTFGLFRGQLVADPSGRLEHGSRTMASVKVRTTDDIDERLFGDWLAQAGGRA